MTDYKYCSACDKSKQRTNNSWQHYRKGEGYLVLSIKDGIEITKECPTCHGFGYIFVREYEVGIEMDLQDYIPLTKQEII